MSIVSAERAVEVVAELLRARSAPPGVTGKVLAIDGPGGAGKSTLAARVSDALGRPDNAGRCPAPTRRGARPGSSLSHVLGELDA